MQKTCLNPWCKQSFEITAEDEQLLKKCSPVIAGVKHALPSPSLCPQCRLQRRLSHYNCRSLYRRTCAETGKPMVSVYSPDKKVHAIDPSVWWSDAWDPLAYGRAIDFAKPFFPQMHSLMRESPLIGLSIIGDNVNSDFTNDNYKTKNCYLVFDGEQAENCYHGHTFVQVCDAIDFLFLMNSELCYECVHVQSSYNLTFSRFCNNCSDSWFLRDCIGCKYCFGCANLRQKQYCIFNEQKTKEEFDSFLASFDSSSYLAVCAMRERVELFFLSQPVRATRGEQCEQCTGDNLSQSQRAVSCFDCVGLQDCRYLSDCLMGAKDCMDIHVWGDGMELCYENLLVGAQVRSGIGNVYVTQGADNVHYSMWCGRGSHDLFGCVNLRHRSYCILNVQYTQEEYEVLVSRLIDHMRSTGEWGEFLPSRDSLFGYNETMAQSICPLQKDEALSRGFHWSEYSPSVEARRSIPAKDLPDRTDDVPDDVLEWALLCEVSGKPYKLLRQELAYYRSYRLPIPRRHPDIRHFDRFAFKNPYRLFPRSCASCQTSIQTSYAPDRLEKVLCERCYLETVY